MSYFDLQNRASPPILADGAMGTELYARGVFVNRCFESLNLTNPDLVESIHRDYIAAGSQIIETNTFSANRHQLQAHGLADKTAAINEAAVSIAKKARGNAKVAIAGAIGPLGAPMAPFGKISVLEATRFFTEQISALSRAGADLLLFETFTHLEELKLAVETAKKVSHLPIIAQFSTNYVGEGRFDGIQPAEAAEAMSTWGVAAVGVNCANGPQGILECIKLMHTHTTLPISAMPNAGLPQSTQGRLIYPATPEYMGEFARRLVQAGATIVGGCCGTSPAMIAEMAKFIKSVRPTLTVTDLEPKKEKKHYHPVPLADKGPLAAGLTKKLSISVEVNPPATLSVEQTIEGVKKLKAIGVDAVNIPDGPRAMARMSPLALAQIIRQHVDIPTIVHYCCRDRNILGMQMDLLGAHALGLNNLLLITGDPPKMGTYPDATAVFDIDSIGLIKLVNQLNHGYDLSGRDLGGVTRFLIGCGCNPGAINRDEEIKRYALKVENGAEFIFSQPVFDLGYLRDFMSHTATIRRPAFFAGVMPFVSLKNAEFFHNEVPGMSIPPDIMERMRQAGTKEQQLQTGLDIAREIVKEAVKLDGISGIYIFPPMGRYDLVEEIIKVL